MISNKSIGGKAFANDSDIVKRLYVKMFNEQPASSTDGYTPETRKILTNTPVEKQEPTKNNVGMSIIDRRTNVPLLNIDLVDTKYTRESVNKVIDRSFQDYADKFGNILPETENNNTDPEQELKRLQAENEALNSALVDSDNRINELNYNFKKTLEEINKQNSDENCTPTTTTPPATIENIPKPPPPKPATQEVKLSSFLLRRAADEANTRKGQIILLNKNKIKNLVTNPNGLEVLTKLVAIYKLPNAAAILKKIFR